MAPTKPMPARTNGNRACPARDARDVVTLAEDGGREPRTATWCHEPAEPRSPHGNRTTTPEKAIRAQRLIGGDNEAQHDRDAERASQKHAGREGMLRRGIFKPIKRSREQG